MKTKPSMNRTFLASQTLVAVVSIALVGSLWIYSQYSGFQQEAEAIRQEYLVSQRAVIKNEVDKVVDFVHYQQAQALDRLKTSIENRVYEAHAIALNIYERNRDQESPVEIAGMIRDALRPIRFNSGRGYYFATHVNGIEELFADRPELEGKDMLLIQGGRGEYVVRDMIELVKRSGEGFYQYAWSRPGREGNLHLKIAFVKWFEPLGWFIGTGEYLEDVEQDIQLETMDRIEKIAFGKDGYIFACRWDGLALAGPGKGRNMIDVKDASGLQVVRELIEISKRGGGYLEYVMPSLGQARTAPKLSYVVGIDPWQCYVGAGIFIDEIEQVLLEKKADLDRKISRDLLKIVAILLGVIVLACAVSLHTARKIGGALGTFSAFFKRAARELETIEPDAAGYAEFEDLVESANRMISERRRIEEAHKLDELRLEAVLQLNAMSNATLRELAGHAMEEAVRLTQSEIGYIAFMSADQTTLTMHAWSRSAMEECRVDDKPIDYPVETTGLWGEAVRQRRPIISNDYAAPNPWNKGTPPGHVVIRRHMNVPIFDGDRIVIVAGVGNKPADYDEADIRQLTLLMSGMWGITELRRAEAERDRLFNLSMDMLCTAGFDGFLKQVNPAWSLTLGWSQEELMTRPWLDFVHPEDREATLGAGELLLSGKPIQEFENRFRCRDGSYRWLSWNSFPRPNEGLIFAVTRDITERKLAEQEKEKLETRVRQAQKMEAIGTLSGGIAHDFNNILAAVLGYAEMALMGMPEASPEQFYLEQVVKASHRAKDLVQQILAFSRKADTQEMRPLEMGPTIKEALRLLRATLPTTIELRDKIPEVSGMIVADPTQIHQVVMNLCTNAAHAMRAQGGEIVVGIADAQLDAHTAQLYPNARPGKYLTLSVRDTGHGMDSATLERAFDPYFTTKPAGEGSGLGLAMVHGIVQRHQGAITVHSEPEKGTCFRVYFPKVETVQEAKSDALEPIRGGTERILYVDDEELLVALGKTMLEQLGYPVTGTTSSLQALELFRARPDAFDLIITDYTMPHLTGIDLARKIFAMRPEIPIILCTGFSEDVNEERAGELGIRAFIMKPLSRRNISETIRSALDQVHNIVPEGFRP
jgi:PAS domain S-box-containing protein